MHMDKITSGFTVKPLEAEPAPLAEIPVMPEAGFTCGRIAFIGVDEDLCSGPLTSPHVNSSRNALSSRPDKAQVPRLGATILQMPASHLPGTFFRHALLQGV